MGYGFPTCCSVLDAAGPTLDLILGSTQSPMGITTPSLLFFSSSSVTAAVSVKMGRRSKADRHKLTRAG